VIDLSIPPHNQRMAGFAVFFDDFGFGKPQRD
jgi:hypothetical protein